VDVLLRLRVEDSRILFPEHVFAPSNIAGDGRSQLLNQVILANMQTVYAGLASK
jgi:hypothetical protein